MKVAVWLTPIVLFETPRTNLLLAVEDKFSWLKVWFLSVLFTTRMYLPDVPLAKPVMELLVVPVSLKRAPEDRE